MVRATVDPSQGGAEPSRVRSTTVTTYVRGAVWGGGGWVGRRRCGRGPGVRRSGAVDIPGSRFCVSPEKVRGPRPTRPKGRAGDPLHTFRRQLDIPDSTILPDPDSLKYKKGWVDRSGRESEERFCFSEIFIFHCPLRLRESRPTLNR